MAWNRMRSVEGLRDARLTDAEQIAAGNENRRVLRCGSAQR